MNDDLRALSERDTQRWKEIEHQLEVCLAMLRDIRYRLGDASDQPRVPPKTGGVS